MRAAPANESGRLVGEGVRLGDLIERFGGSILGDPDYRIRQVATLRSAGPGELSFCHQGKYLEELRQTRAGAVVIAPKDSDATTIHRILAEDAYLYFARVSALLNAPERATPGIHPSAAVAESALIDASAAVGPHCHIDARARIGAGVRIGAGTTIGAGATIGNDTRIDPGVTIYPGTRIGARCVLLAGAVVGSDGFGFAPDGERWFKIPQIGAVVIGDDVEVGANTTIDRGALDDTVIESGVKLDNQVQIGHNCRIGANTAVAGCVGIAGSTTIGEHCMIGGAAMISGHLVIADGVVVSGGTAITRSISERGIYTGVYPFESNRRWTKNAALLRHLDDLVARVRALERRIGGPENEK